MRLYESPMIRVHGYTNWTGGVQEEPEHDFRINRSVSVVGVEYATRFGVHRETFAKLWARFTAFTSSSSSTHVATPARLIGISRIFISGRRSFSSIEEKRLIRITEVQLSLKMWADLTALSALRTHLVACVVYEGFWARRRSA
jgi:hypothetical protein